MDIQPTEGSVSEELVSLSELTRRANSAPIMLFSTDQRPQQPADSRLTAITPGLLETLLISGGPAVESFTVECLISRFRPSPFSTIAVVGSPHLANKLLRWFPNVLIGEPEDETDYILVLRNSGEAQLDIPSSLIDALRPGGVLLVAGEVPNLADPTPWLIAEALRGHGLADSGVLLRGTGRELNSLHGSVVVGRRPRKRSTSVRQSRAQISVVVPVYNHERYLPETLESIFRQSLPPEEVIVIDDGSQDNSAAVADELCSGYPGAIFWSHRNRGAHNTINAGLHRATQPVVAILNSDDRYHPDRLRLCGRLFENPHVQFVASGLAFIDDSGASIENQWFHDALQFWRQIGNSSLALLNGNFIMTTSNLLVRRSVFDEIGMFNNLRYAHDLDFFLRLLRASKPLTFLSEDLVDYRIHRTNTIKEAHVGVRTEVGFLYASILLSCPDSLLEGMTLAEYMRQFDVIVRRHGLGACIAALIQRAHRLGLHGPDSFGPLMADNDFRLQLHEICS